MRFFPQNRKTVATDTYWQKRLEDLERKHECIVRIMECEYSRAMDEYGGNEAIDYMKKGNLKTDNVPCKDLRGCLAKCYKENPDKSMNCVLEFQKYINCVDQARMCALHKKN